MENTKENRKLIKSVILMSTLGIVVFSLFMLFGQFNGNDYRLAGFMFLMGMLGYSIGLLKKVK